MEEEIIGFAAILTETNGTQGEAQEAPPQIIPSEPQRLATNYGLYAIVPESASDVVREEEVSDENQPEISLEAREAEEIIKYIPSRHEIRRLKAEETLQKAKRRLRTSYPPAEEPGVSHQRSQLGPQTESPKRTAPKFSFGTGPRFSSPERLYISREHCRTILPSYTPGPSYDNYRGSLASKVENLPRLGRGCITRSEPRFAMQTRTENYFGLNPGPGEYDVSRASHHVSTHHDDHTAAFTTGTRILIVEKGFEREFFGQQSPGPIYFPGGEPTGNVFPVPGSPRGFGVSFGSVGGGKAAPAPPSAEATEPMEPTDTADLDPEATAGSIGGDKGVDGRSGGKSLEPSRSPNSPLRGGGGGANRQISQLRFKTFQGPRFSKALRDIAPERMNADERRAASVPGPGAYRPDDRGVRANPKLYRFGTESVEKSAMVSLSEQHAAKVLEGRGAGFGTYSPTLAGIGPSCVSTSRTAASHAFTQTQKLPKIVNLVPGPGSYVV